MFSVSIRGVLLIWRSSPLSLHALLLLLLLHVSHDVISVPHKPTVSATTKAIHVFQSACIHHLRQPQDQTQFPDIHKLSPDAILLYGRVDGSMVELEPRFEKTSPFIEIEVLSLHALG
ncbi:BAG family molecular chaperone regulator 5 [Pyrus ussuriensis x Pyrus communis]|uniref:BAG family molecular chaperone regulator 5 n=1 Tax=Pyrus ussuriensis x Pyrus communis TaxID=2448454 RepID=A0A5N5FKU0_9ROSA|nr:BAG family molecular chaperone regulator 5 [Pyrus ussuriensis x Pyrus communis]